MPTYAYECQACGHDFEQFQSMTAKALRKCPECKKSKLQRLIGPGAGIIFKGSGFYETDYRSEAYKKSAKADSEQSSSSDSSNSEGPSESEGTSKSDSKANGKDKSGDKPDTKGKTGSEKTKSEN